MHVHIVYSCVWYWVFKHVHVPTQDVTISAPHPNISQDAGVYRGVVTNPYGKNSSSVVVKITCTLPKFGTNVSV